MRFVASEYKILNLIVRIACIQQLFHKEQQRMRDVYDIFFNGEMTQAIACFLRDLLGLSAAVHYRMLMSLCCIVPANVQSQPSEEPLGLILREFFRT